MLLVDSDVEQVHLEVSELEDEPFDEDRQVVVLLLSVVLEVCRVHCYFLELQVEDCGENSLGYRSNQIHVVIRVTDSTRVGQMRQR